MATRVGSALSPNGLQVYFNIQALLSKVTNEEGHAYKYGTRSLRPREQLERGKKDEQRRRDARRIRFDLFEFAETFSDESRTAD